MRRNYIAIAIAAAVLTSSMLSCSKDDSEPTSHAGTTNGTTSGSTSGSTSGTSSGTTSATTSGSTSGNNTGTGSGNYTYGFSQITSTHVFCNVSNGYYQIGGTYYDYSCTVTLGSSTAPTTNGTYTLTDSGTPQPGEANVRIIDSGQSTMFISTGGELIVTVAGNVVQASFNDIPVRKMSDGTIITASGSFYCQ